MTKITDEIQSLFRKCRSELGAPVVDVELKDEQLCDLLEMAIEDYAEKVQNWLIVNQWATLYGKDVSNTDMAYALSVRTFDMSRDFSYWFSKEAGLQQRGPWELKKDFFTVEEGKQSYLIPAGREINSVMWCNPSTSFRRWIRAGWRRFIRAYWRILHCTECRHCLYGNRLGIQEPTSSWRFNI